MILYDIETFFKKCFEKLGPLNYCCEFRQVAWMPEFITTQTEIRTKDMGEQGGFGKE